MGGWFFLLFLLFTFPFLYLMYDITALVKSQENLIQDFKVAALYPYWGFNQIVRKINEKAFSLSSAC